MDLQCVFKNETKADIYYNYAEYFPWKVPNYGKWNNPGAKARGRKRRVGVLSSVSLTDARYAQTPAIALYKVGLS